MKRVKEKHLSDHTNGIEAMRQRMLQLVKEGLDQSRAWGTAALENRIARWSDLEGEHLSIIVFGDFEAPEEELQFPSLGITIYPEKIESSIGNPARCTLKATVETQEKSVPALIDAARRINVLLGAWTLVTWGNGPIRWWSWLTNDTGGGIRESLDHKDLSHTIDGVIALPENIRRRVDNALYWIREPSNLLMELHRSELLRMYVAYWNAFECLVDAVNILRPPRRHTKPEKQRMIDDFLANLSRPPTASDIQECYTSIVNPGFVSKASHALRECFGTDSDRQIDECFRLSQKGDRLYIIRNAISHGDIDAENPEELIRIQAQLTKLKVMVLGMFGRFIPYPAPVDRPSSP